MSQDSCLPSDPAMRRAVWPELMFAPDVALALDLQSASAARRVMKSGRIGPHLFLGRRIACRRESLMASLRASERLPGAVAPAPATDVVPAR